ncbi:proprotein convertase P-domain-containing protein [Polaribacter pectinis]|uniref:Proprotein convertase P-domain-containing protein n=1 Tax=Polaribacter pectinis TaxID=2738844 RepID=A0A7G9L713_9FLAO|nr:proprotein convertase P-domain-containing protein [Polaribacter pectinis]QNM84412.1 proprotein convertase P-domain-containing protein [Polaribacter pectinis]
MKNNINITKLFWGRFCTKSHYLIIFFLLLSSVFYSQSTESISNTNSQSIPDNNSTGITKTFPVVNSGLISNVTIVVDIDHTYRGDLILTLRSPDNTTITLTDQNGGASDNLKVNFDDDGLTSITADNANHSTTVIRIPEDALSTFDNENANGTWTLNISDNANIDTGTFNSATISVTTQKDSDGDGVGDDVDEDDDNDGILDIDESSCEIFEVQGYSAVVYDGVSGQNSWNLISASNTFPVTGFSQVATFDYEEFNGTSKGFYIDFKENPFDLHTSSDGDVSNYSGTPIPENDDDAAIVFTKTITAAEEGIYNFDIDYGDDHIFFYINGVKQYQVQNAYGPFPQDASYNTVSAGITFNAGDVISLVVVEEFRFNTEIDIRFIKTNNIGGGPATCFIDSDGDGVPNSLDLDSDNDGIPDVIEAGGTDANRDGRADDNDNNADNTGSNGIPTTAGTGLTPLDSDGDLLLNYLDIDSDNDGIPDNIEGQTTSGYTAPSSTFADVNDNGVDDVYESGAIVGLNPPNTDSGNDTIPDYLDSDSDNDGITDIFENGDTDNKLSGLDTDGDGLDNNFDDNDDSAIAGATVNDGINPPNATNLGDEDNDLGSGGDVDYRDIKDSDNDGVADSVDLDDDNDGILDTVECGSLKTMDISLTKPNLTYTSNGNPGKVGDVARYANVGTFEGVAVDLRITVASNTNPSLVDADLSGYEFDPMDGNPVILYPIHLTSTNGTSAGTGFVNFDFEFLINGTSTLIKVPANMVFQDIDNTSPGELIEFNVANILNYKVSTATAIEVNNATTSSTGASGDFLKVTSTDNAGGVLDEKLWFGIQMPYVDKFDITMSKRVSNTGYLFNSTAFTGPTVGTCVADFDSDGIPNHLDLDSDNDGITDVIESGGTDANNDGRADDNDNNANNTGSNGIPTTAGTGNTPANTDGDTNSDFLDIDADNDGIPDNIEGQTSSGYVEPSGVGINITDVNKNGVDDVYEVGGIGLTPPNTDSANDTIPDYIDLDTDNDGIPDIQENGDANNFAFGTDADNDGLDDAFDDNDDSNISGFTVNDGLGTGNKVTDVATLDTAYGDEDNNFPGAGDVDYRDVKDTDKDGVPDAVDLDDDNDGILDEDEGCRTITTTVDLASKILTMSGDPGIIYSYDVNTNTLTTEATLTARHNAMAYNTSDKYIWTNNRSTNQLAVYDPSNNFAKINTIPATALPNVISATYNPAQKVYIANSAATVFVLDGDPTSATYGQVKFSFANTIAAGFNDISFNSNDGFAYGIRNNTTDLIRINISNKTTTNIGSVSGLPSGSYGRSFYLTNGSMYFVRNSTLAMYKIDLSVGQSATLIQTLNLSPSSAGRDAATIPNIGFKGQTICKDTDGDGIPDSLDLDSDNDGIPDVIESGGTDANRDGMADDDDDNADNTATNGIPTSAGTGVVTPTNSDGDLLPDYLDIDADNDGIPDNIEAQTSNGYIPPSGVGTGITDANKNGVDDVYETGAIVGLDPENTDNFDTADYIDSDSDNDGILDIQENGDTDNELAGTDTDNDGLDDNFDDNDDSGISGATVNDGLGANDKVTDEATLETAYGDEDNDFNPGAGDLDYRDAKDTDNDGIPDNVDLDDDNDGVLDTIECGFVNPDFSTLNFTNQVITTSTGSSITISSGVLTAVSGSDARGDALGNIRLSDGNTNAPNPPDYTLGDLYELNFPSPVKVLISNITASIAGFDGLSSGGDEIRVTSATPLILNDPDNQLFIQSRGANYIEFRPVLGSNITAGNGTWSITTNQPTSQISIQGAGNPATGVNIQLFLCEDTDGDGVPNYLDLDSDNDGIPDLVEAGGEDTDGNGLIDDINTDGTLVNDFDNDGLDDRYDADVTGGTDGNAITNPDSDGDGIPDSLDLDSDNDGIPDVVEAGGTDSNGDGRADGFVDTDKDGFNDLVDGDVGQDGTSENTANALIVTGDDANNDGKPDTYPNGDTDKDGFPDFIDLDADNDGIPDLVEAGGVDTNGDGLVDNTTDVDQDGLADIYDENATDGPGPDGTNGIALVETDATGNMLDGDGNSIDTDGDGFPDHLDLDADNDGIPDLVEAGGVDTNGDGLVDNTTDADKDGFADIYDTDDDGTPGVEDANDALLQTGGTDTDGDGKADDAAITFVNGEGANADTDGDGFPDHLDLDADNDGIPDLVEAGGVDTNGDGLVDNTTDADKDGFADIYDTDDDGTPGVEDANDALLQTGGTDTDGDGKADDAAITFVNGEGTNADTDKDGIPNHLDLDADNDGIPDLVEAGGVDTNGDGLVDNTTDADKDGFADVYDTDDDGTPGVEDANDALLQTGGTDTDGDGKADDAAITFVNGEGNNADTDGDGLPNHLDLDADNDGIPDLVEAGGVDTNGDGLVDNTTDADKDGFADIYDTDDDGTPGVEDANDALLQTGGTDTDGDGKADDAAITFVNGEGTNADTDGDGLPNHLDLDADNDGIPDLVEAGGVDTNGDGLVDNTTDADKDGFADIYDTDDDGTPGVEDANDALLQTGGTDTDGDGKADDAAIIFVNGEGTNADTDKDGFPNHLDLDADNDGIPDLVEAGGVDTNGDGLVDNTTDADKDGFADIYDTDDDGTSGVEDANDALLQTGGTDTDGDGKADDAAITFVNGEGANADTDKDGFPNHLDLDADNDGIPDVVEAGGTDVNGDGRADNFDDTDNDGFNDDVDGDVGQDGTSENIANVLILTGTDTGNDGKAKFLHKRRCRWRWKIKSFRFRC